MWTVIALIGAGFFASLGIYAALAHAMMQPPDDPDDEMWVW